MTSTPLLRLPVEMLRNITGYLDLQDQARLSMTNRYLRFTLPAPTHSDFLAAEASEWAMSKQLFTCKGCSKFRGLPQFADDMRKGARARSGSDARARFCLDCGVENGWYAEGAKIAIYGKPAVLGRHCSGLTDRRDDEASCGSRALALAWRPARSERHSRYADDYTRECSDDGWAGLSRSHAGARHVQEECEWWLDL